MDNKLKKQIKVNLKKQIKALTKELQENSIALIDRTLNSGAIGEDSDFLKLDNNLLARCIMENEFENFKLHSPDYVKESKNIKMFL